MVDVGNMPDPRYIASPLKNYSYHNKGVAVDVTLVDAEDCELAMPSKFDDLSEGQIEATVLHQRNKKIIPYS